LNRFSEQLKGLHGGMNIVLFGFAGLLVLSHYFLPGRIFFMVIILAVIVLGTVLTHLDKLTIRLSKKHMVFFGFVVLIATSYSFLNASRSIIGLHLRWQSRIEYIYTEKQNGNLNLVVKPIRADSKHAAQNLLCDVRNDKDYWVNQSVARYFGIETIQSVGDIPEKVRLSRVFNLRPHRFVVNDSTK